MRKKDIHNLINRGFRKLVKDAEDFEKESSRVDQEIMNFKNDMKQWSKNRRFTRNK